LLSLYLFLSVALSFLSLLHNAPTCILAVGWCCTCYPPPAPSPLPAGVAKRVAPRATQGRAKRPRAAPSLSDLTEKELKQGAHAALASLVERVGLQAALQFLSQDANGTAQLGSSAATIGNSGRLDVNKPSHDDVVMEESGLPAAGLAPGSVARIPPSAGLSSSQAVATQLARQLAHAQRLYSTL
jgi:hypothetical protein